MKVSLSLLALFAALNTVTAAPSVGNSGYGDDQGRGPGHHNGGGHGNGNHPGPMVNSVCFLLRYTKPSTKTKKRSLRSLIKEKALMAKAQKLQDFAELSGTPITRVIGSPGHNATVNWYYDTIKKLDHYYSVYIQAFPVVTAAGNITVNGALIESATMSFTGAGHPVEDLVPVANLGCNAVRPCLTRRIYVSG